MALASREESLQEEDHLRKVSSTFNIKKTECKLSTFCANANLLSLMLH